MNKEILIAVVVVSVIVVLFFVVPINKAPRDLTQYYVCTKCQCVYGAMNGKGPFVKLPKDKGNWCIHNWVKSSREEFDRR